MDIKHILFPVSLLCVVPFIVHILDEEIDWVLLAYLVIVTLSLIVLVFAYFKWSFLYWKRRNVEYIEPTIPTGSFQDTVKRIHPPHEIINKIYRKCREKGLKYGGGYAMTTPFFVPIDLDILKNILVKDFQFFVNRGIYVNEADDPLSAHLLGLSGERWKKVRSASTPVFSSAKMKSMFQTIIKCAEKFEGHINIEEAIDITELINLFTMDVIATTVYNLDCNPYGEHSPFYIHGRNFTDTSHAITHIIGHSFPMIAKIFRLRLISEETTAFFINIVKKCISYRKKNNVKGSDFLQILMDIKTKEINTDDYSTAEINDIAAQCFIFFEAGFETSSIVATFSLFELALNQDMQTKVVDEIHNIFKKYKGNITYESLAEFKYTQQIIDEAQRKHPSTSFVTRVCEDDYKIPNTNLTLEKGTSIFIPISALHEDKEYFPEPEKFIPERFNDENRQKIPQFAYMPFGEGPRSCIGLRFGMMVVKICLIYLLRNHKFTVSHKTNFPLKLLPGIIRKVEGGVWLQAEQHYCNSKTSSKTIIIN